MGKRENHHYRFIAMKDFNKKHLKTEKEFDLQQMVEFLNSYRTDSGKIHRGTGTDKNQLTAILLRHKDYDKIGIRKWKYVGG